jgi:phytanoyl-CoA hydroxylase
MVYQTTQENKAQQLEEHGFCIINDVFGEKQLQPRRDLVNQIIEFYERDNADPFDGEGCVYRRHRVDQGVLYDVYQRYPSFQQMASEENVLDVVEGVLGPNIYLYVNSVVYKPKDGDNEVPFHQDFMDRPDESDRYIAWMPLYDATRENGCLKVIPGSHTDGFKSYHVEEGETHHTRLNEDQYDSDVVEYLEMKAGDVLFFHQHLMHGSDEVSSSAPRHAFRSVYKAPYPDDVITPRGGPIMLRGGYPESLKTAGAAAKRTESRKKGIIKKGIHYVGRQLQEM